MKELLSLVVCITLNHFNFGLSITSAYAFTVHFLSILSEAAPQLYNWGDTYA